MVESRPVRKDGKPLTTGDKEQARHMAALETPGMGTQGQTSRLAHRTTHELIDFDHDKISALLIDSDLGPLWLAFLDDFCPGDEIPVFYPDELQFLKDKPATTLRKIYETKCAFGLGTRVRH